MISARIEPTQKKIMIILDVPEKDILIETFTAYLHRLRTVEKNELNAELEALETLRFRVRSAQNHADKRYQIFISYIEAFFFTQTLQNIIQCRFVSKQPPDEHQSMLVIFTKTISNLLNEIFDRREYDELMNVAPESVSYLYIQYIEHLLENHNALLEEMPKALLALLSQCRHEANTSHDPSGDGTALPALPYPQFRMRCEAWMKKHEMNDMCLEEIIADKTFY